MKSEKDFREKKTLGSTVSSKEEKNKRIPRFIIATGGTGGHIYPALRIAELIQEEIDWNSKIHFVGTRYGMEGNIIKNKTSYPLHFLSIGRLNRNVSFFERLKTLFQLPFSLLQSMVLILKLRPDLILGMGGHASGPFLLMGVLLGKKTFIWEPNIYPGMTNRILASLVQKILISLPETRKYLEHGKRKRKNIFQVSYPVRKEMVQVRKEMMGSPLSKNPSFEVFSSDFLPSDPREKQMNSRLNFLVLGGSQGAFSINTVIFEAYKKSRSLIQGVNLIHQTGEKDFKRMKMLFEEERKKRGLEKGVKKNGEEGIFLFSLKAFLEDIGAYYHWADLVLCRSGIGTLFELSAACKPSILIPYPYSSDDHQLRNAKKWESSKASILILEKDLNPEGLIKILNELKKDKNRMTNFSLQAKKLYPFDGKNKDWVSYLKEPLYNSLK